ncbi:hypothetical protein AB0I28_06125 [Phytomonospora sp. NPDC050363]|uniref:hypothetical protein n=1 Tax=Phytomonospora sp. NPDC050363 TaxID=3155642 RepID=UPI00340D7A95
MRAQQWTPPAYARIAIRGLSAATCRDIARAELRDDHPFLWRGGTALALHGLGKFLARPGRYLYLRRSLCTAGACELIDDVAHARDYLAMILPVLPLRSRRELGRMLAGLDKEILRRTIPDPFPPEGTWRVLQGLCGWEWWHRRIYEG